MKELNYKENYNLPEGSFRISPSMISKFTDKKWEWYRSEVLGEETFKGNTSTFLGTCVHRVLEYFLKGKEVDYEEIESYIDSIMNLDVDKEFIRNQYRVMSQAVIKHLITTTVPEISEETVSVNVKDSVYLAGTFDALYKDVLIDFKTTSSKSPKLEIPYYYKWQLLAYAYALRKNNIEVNYIKLIYVTTNEVNRISEKTGKPLKDYPSEVVEVTEPITEDDMKFIEDYIKLIAETYLKGEELPELIYLLYSDYRLKKHFDTPFS